MASIERQPLEGDMQQYAADILHVEVIPGTDIMRDVEGIRFAHGGNKDVVLIPQPTRDPHDPLNWSYKWKYLAILIQFLFTFVTVETALPIAPLFPLLAERFKVGDTKLGLLTGGMVIAGGYANFIIVPLSNIMGRRLTCIAFACLTLGTSIWQATATSYNSLLAARIINGFATSTNESLMMQVVADTFFLHERGYSTGIYFTTYFVGIFIGPIISGNIGERYGWRSFFWVATGQCAFVLILLIVGFPETKYRRDQKAMDNLPTEPTSPKAEHVEVEITTSVASSSALTGHGRPSKGQFMPYQKPDSRWKQFLVRDIISPVRVFVYPIIFWAGLMVAGPANLLLFWNLTESTILAAPPYNWTPSQVGYSNFSFAVGGLIGLFTAGPFSDWIAARATARNNGVREAEMRLPALIPYVAVTAIAIIIGGIGYDRHWPWEVILCIAYAITGLSVTTIPTIAIAYAVDCYKPVSGEIMVVATVLKNTIGFSMSYWVPSLAAKKGFIAPAMVEFALTIGPAILMIPMYFYGKKLRRQTKNSWIHKMEELL